MKKTTLNLLLGISLLFSATSFAQANDNIANAEAISCGNVYTGSTAAATLDQADPTLHFGVDLDAPNVWYTYTGSGSEESITLDLCGSGYDTSVLVLTGAPGSLTAYAGNDDDNTCSSNTLNSRITFTSDGTTTYYIAVEGFNSGSTGAYTMNVTCTSVTPPAVYNQTCLTALAVDVDASIITSDNSFGDISPTQPTCDNFGSIQDVWFSFVAPSPTVDVTVTKGTMLSANFAVYSGTCDALVSLGCNSNLTVALTQSFTTLVSGDTYFVQVWSNGAEQGDFTLSLSDPSICKPTATYETVANCIDNNFTINADITSFASASTVTVTDNQASSGQTIGTPGIVTFGPYAFGTSVVLTITNDQSPGCALVSPNQTSVGCPPVNDECTNAIALTVNPDNVCTGVTPGTITAATASLTDTASCGGTEDDDVWFSFVATNTVHTISLNNIVGSTTDLFHSLWTGADCSSLTLVPNTCSDPNTSTPSGLVIGETYYLRVYSWTPTIGQTATFDVCIGTPPPPPANDECANAIALNCGDVLTNQSTDSATGGTATSCVGTIGNDIWYSFLGDGQVITLTATATGVESPQVEVYASTDGTCAGFAPGTCIAAAGTGETVVSTSFVSVNGTSYYIHIGSWINGDPATIFDLAITCEAPATPPANDDCDGAESLTVNPDASCTIVTSGTVAGATASAVDASICGGSPDDDVWYSFVATGTIQAISLINVAGANTDLFHSLWTGDCGTLTLVPGSCSDANASLPTGLTEGQTYYVRVYTTTTTALQNTTFDICVGTPPPPPANDDCTGAIEITAGGEFITSPVIGSNVSSTSTVGLPTFSCQTNRSNDVWYSVVVPASGSLTIETNSAPGTVMTDSVISIYSGTCGSLVEIGCDDDSSDEGNFSKEVLTGLTPGDTIYIGVWKYGTSLDGDFQLSAYDASLLSNDTFETSSFKAYPNPVKDMLNLSYSKNISNVAIYNLLGQEVNAKSTNANLSQIDMSNLANGTYLVKVTADNQIKTIKVIKE
ncbi:T9SS type A sorting domain-containing protein [Flavobacterium sp.]|uniref:T9SS type A sorting domain-containing protein n=1 Tax=Flavobacterium sp. TaxID=239 RepID=UPI00286A2038|nr:T9SS type A sorting domain-containing protein [Flavobacterium sp.]